MSAVITATGLWTPSESISNEELVTSYNAYADKWNAEQAQAIAAGTAEALSHSSPEFIEKASGIKSRYVVSKPAVLDINIMAPRIPKRADDDLSIMAEIACHAGRDALKRAGRVVEDVDAIIVACSKLQRAYPAISIEVQNELGAGGFAFDMNVACASATFGIETARGLISTGQAKSVLVLNPEICTGHINFKDRDGHFIFGDVATAILIEDESRAGDQGWNIVGSKLVTQFSNNIRNNFGYLNVCAPEDHGMNASGHTDKLFRQRGRSVFKEVVPMVANLITDELANMGIDTAEIKRMWLHQANINMNTLITKKVLGKDVDMVYAPVVLDEYANTSSAGSIIAFHKHSHGIKVGETALICAFGAGYSAGLVVLEKR